MSSASDVQPYTMWCFGLSDEDMARISRCAEDCTVSARDPQDLGDEAALAAEEPTLFWIHHSVWRDADVSRLAGGGATVPKVLVMDAGHAPDDLDVFIDLDAEHVLRAPLQEHGVYRILRRTLEVCCIHQDMGRMAREILMNRDMLVRKESVLDLMFQAEQALADARSVREVLAGLRAALSPLLSMRQMHAAVWNPSLNASGVKLFYDGFTVKSKNAAPWRAILVDAVERLGGSALAVAGEERLFTGVNLSPADGSLLLLPLRHRDTAVGALMFLLPGEAECSLDENHALSLILARAAGLVRLAQTEHTVLANAGTVFSPAS
jgi:hypothetical protein